MNCAQESMLDSMKHRGCGVRPASYEIAPKEWLPEASVSLPTETGSRRLWIHSFAHCFDAEKLTFSTKFDADNWAIVAARAIVDRALDEAEASTMIRPAKAPKSSVSLRQLTRYSLLVLGCCKLFR